MSGRIRLIEVQVQPRFVLDTGEQLEPLPHPPITIPAHEWAAYSGERFPREVADWQARLDTEQDTPLTDEELTHELEAL